MKYPKVINLWNRDAAWLKDAHNYPVYLQEKIDGSQFGFGKTNEGVPFVHSKSTTAVGDNPTLAGQFTLAVETAMNVMPMVGCGMHIIGEAVTKPKHNKLQYDRIPEGGIIIFDAMENGEYCDLVILQYVAMDLGLESVPYCKWPDYPADRYVTPEKLEDLGQRWPPHLGGEFVEGLVVKPGLLFRHHYPPVKWVREEFREKDKEKTRTPRGQGPAIVQAIIERYRTSARWDKAIQHLRDEGSLTDDMKDVGLLLREIHMDLEEEEREAIMEALYDGFIKQIKKGVVDGFAPYYRSKLLMEA